MRLFPLMSFLLIRNVRPGVLGGGRQEPHSLLELSLLQFIETNTSLEHLAAEMRDVNDQVVKSIHLKYANHPHERALVKVEMEDDMEANGKNFSSTFNSTRRATSSPTSGPTISPSTFPSSIPTTKAAEPIRIVFETTELERRGNEDVKIGARVEKITQNVLPKISEIWSSILSVTPVENSIPITDDACYGFIDFPTNVIEDGIADADLVVFVSAHNKINNVTLCDYNALASASYCSLDQYDRPVVGFINLCIENIDVENNEDAAVAVGAHELAHVLGFSDDLFKFFRNSDNGEPLTERPFKKSTVKCVDGSTKKKSLASDLTLQQKGNDGSLYYEIVSPTVVEIAKNHFNCDSLSGVRLENQPTRDSCTGSHWDERFFFTDLMSPIFSSDSVSLLSPLTIALLKDTGWYKEVSFASRYIRNTPFGLGAGCDFLDEDSCIDNNKVPEEYSEYFCDTVTKFSKDGLPTKGSATTCDPSFSHIAYCSLVDLSSEQQDYKSRQGIYSLLNIPNSFLSHIYTARQDIPARFDNPNLGSLFLQADNCPIASIFDVDCTDPSTNINNKLYPEEEYGVHSKCFNSIFEHPAHGGIARGLCLKSHCNRIDGTLEVFVGGQTIVCNHDGEKHQLPLSDDVYFVCPPLYSICPALACPSMCSGQGICNHDIDPPQCECYDEDDTSPGCFGVGVDYELDDGSDFVYPNRPVEEIIFGDNASYQTQSTCTFVNVLLVATTLALIIL